MLFCFNVTVNIRYDKNGLYAAVRYLFVKYRFYPEKPPKQKMTVKDLKRKRKKLHKKGAKIGEKKKSKKASGKKRTKSFDDILSLVKEISGIVFDILGKGVKYARIYIRNLDITVSTEDAAKTALAHTAVCNVINSMIKRIENAGWRIKYGNMECRCDYLSGKFSCETDIVIRVKVWHLIYTLLSSLIKYFKLTNINGGSTNGK